MDNDGGFEITDGGPTQAATYEEAGTYTAGVRVTDNDGLTDTATASVTVSVIELFPPVAALSATPDTGVTPLEVIYDASASTDSDGTIVQYDWDMDNDGGFEITDGGPEQTAAYDSGGVYTAGVRVTDNDGLSDSTTASVDANEKPVANLTATPTFGNAPGLEVTFDASGSTDGDGTIEQYEWDMENDGTFEITDGGPIQIVVYDSGSIHTVVVRVTDNDGLQDTASADVDVNNPPLADLLATPDGGVAPLSITYDASGSTDGDGTIVQYDWDLDDDGTFEVTDGGPAQEVPYQGHGTFAVSVRVIDDDGAQDTASTSVDVLSPPIADLVAEPPGGNAPELEIIFDASASFDPDGTIVQYDWDMDGDGTFELTDGGTMQTAFYNVGGLYTVNVRVTDNDGLTGIASVIVDVNEPPTAIIQTDPDPPDIYGEGETVAFDATSSFDVDGTVVQYDWDLDGDGTYEIIDGSPMQTHYYFIEGGFPEFTWVILLRVIDDDGAEGYAFVEVYASYNGNGF